MGKKGKLPGEIPVSDLVAKFGVSKDQAAKNLTGISPSLMKKMIDGIYAPSPIISAFLKDEAEIKAQGPDPEGWESEEPPTGIQPAEINLKAVVQKIQLEVKEKGTYPDSLIVSPAVYQQMKNDIESKYPALPPYSSYHTMNVLGVPVEIDPNAPSDVVTLVNKKMLQAQESIQKWLKGSADGGKVIFPVKTFVTDPTLLLQKSAAADPSADDPEHFYHEESDGPSTDSNDSDPCPF